MSKRKTETKPRGGNRAVIGQLNSRRSELLSDIRPLKRKLREVDWMLARARAGLI